MSSRPCRSKNPAQCKYHGKPLNTSAEQSTKIVLAGRRIPTKTFSYLTHVGSLKSDDKKTFSYEGQGFSVSLNPDEWRRIARLSGETWLLKKPGNKFLDYWKLHDTQKNAILTWGEEKGYIINEERYLVSWYDDEWEQTMTMTCDSAEEAEIERENVEGDIEKQYVPVATVNFPDATVKAGDTGIEQVLSVVWVAEEAPEYDGVWWADDLDVNRLSAPRGVIIADRVKPWLEFPLKMQ